MENHGAAVDTLPGIAPWDANPGTDALDHMLLAGASEYGASEFLHAAPPDEFQARSLGPLDRLEKRLQADAFPTAFPVPELPEREGGRPGKRAVSRAGKRAKIARSSPQKADTSAAKGRESPQRSKYKGVSKHKHTGKFEAHLWDASVKRAGGKRKNGAQIYLGQYATEVKAAQVYDMAKLSLFRVELNRKGETERVEWCGQNINFPYSNYKEEFEGTLQQSSHKEYVARLKHSAGKGWKGVAEVEGEGGVVKYSATITLYDKTTKSRVKKDVGVFDTDVDAAQAYDRAVDDHKEGKGVKNFPNHACGARR